MRNTNNTRQQTIRQKKNDKSRTQMRGERTDKTRIINKGQPQCAKQYEEKIMRVDIEREMDSKMMKGE
jgi:hypothetical protein